MAACVLAAANRGTLVPSTSAVELMATGQWRLVHVLEVGVETQPAQLLSIDSYGTSLLQL